MSGGGSATGGIPVSPEPSNGARSVGVGCSWAAGLLAVIIAFVLFGFASDLSGVGETYPEDGYSSLGELVGGLAWVFVVIALAAVVIAVRMRKANEPYSHLKTAQHDTSSVDAAGDVAAAPVVTPPTKASGSWSASTTAVVAIQMVQGLLFLAISFRQPVNVQAFFGLFDLAGIWDVSPYAQALGVILIGVAWQYGKSARGARIAVVAVQSLVLVGCLRMIYLYAGGGGEEYRDGYDWQLSSLLATVASVAVIVLAVSGAKGSRD